MEKPRVEKYRGIMNDWYGDTTCVFTSHLVWNLENFKHLFFVVQSVQTFVTVLQLLQK
jgi:hypothetical protein